MIFQKAYDFFKNLKSPKWYVDLTNFLLHNVIIPSLQMIGREALNDLEAWIVTANGKDISGQQKFKYVFDNFRVKYSMPEVKDHVLTSIINLLVTNLKTKKIID